MRNNIFICGYCLRNFSKKYERRYLSSSNQIWESVVGLEVHAQLNTQSKLFSGAENSFGGLVNNYVSLFDAAIPGTLPVLNRKAVELGVITALALSCQVNKESSFDRKHYFYADLPAGYQITQQREPLARDGEINFQVYTPGIHKTPYKKSSKIKQIQLEQDSGKSLHDDQFGRSLVDLNRAGAPLMELVFEPDLKDGEEAAALVKELLLIVQRLGSCSGRMEEGALRVDANVSVNRPGDPFGVRTEIKNIGSVRGVAGAIKSEIHRQISKLEAGERVINETRSWDAENKCTIAMRDKEVVQDYRYMPEPNLPPLRINLETDTYHPDIVSVPSLLKNIPELPEESRRKLVETFNLKPETAIKLVNEPKLFEYFHSLASKNRDNNRIANVLINELLTVINKLKIDITDCKISTKQLGDAIDLLQDRKINLETCRNVLELVITNPELCVMNVVKENNWLLVSDVKQIASLCESVLSENVKLVKQYRGGKVKVLKALIGLAERRGDSRFDMSVVAKVMEELLKK